MLRLGECSATASSGSISIRTPWRSPAAGLVGAEFLQGSLYEIPFDRDQFDLVLCLEVLEHLEDPGSALDELARTGRSDLVVSVPYEPWFRAGSAMRGKYLRTLGNHPEHINHWNRRSLRQLLEAHVEVLDCSVSMPWLVAHCRTRGSAAG